MIANLQFLRAVAAMGVVFYHTDYRLAGNLHTDFEGVAIFFVISGFIMSYITQNGEEDFLFKRLIRIVPLYWIATFLMILTNHRLRIVWPSFWLTGEPALIVDTIRSFLFIPWEKFPVLGIGWTLNFEIYFYAVFAVMLTLSRRWAPVLTAIAVISVIALDRATGERVFLLHFYAHSYVTYFVYGIVLYYVWSILGRFTPRAAAIGCSSLIAVWFGLHFVYPLCPAFVDQWIWIAPIAVVAAALFAESAGLAITWQPALLLGAASYSIYLLHTTWFEQIRPYLRDLALPTAKDSPSVMLFSIASAALVGIAAHLWIEKPLLAKLRNKLKARTPAVEVIRMTSH
ncbi:acyltransferase family protein [Bradyrhizobium sp. AZCC 1721]|uniref:acyltransferase family protein n=1 Tax=Bradyrhizobium sp. AZCC 1721 TaxID=3117016 RepID=UPI002FF3A0E6